jgi:methyltransferase
MSSPGQATATWRGNLQFEIRNLEFVSTSPLFQIPNSKFLIPIFLAVFLPMLVEARRAARNERAQRARGGVEPTGDVYGVMTVVYPASFLAMILEGAFRGLPAWPLVAAGAAVFLAAKALKWWAILTLGAFWTFRVIVVPGAALVARGPYRCLRHPNYVGVLGELGGTAVMTGAAVTGPVSLALFGLILLKRIAIETKALSADV